MNRANLRRFPDQTAGAGNGRVSFWFNRQPAHSETCKSARRDGLHHQHRRCSLGRVSRPGAQEAAAPALDKDDHDRRSYKAGQVALHPPPRPTSHRARPRPGGNPRRAGQNETQAVAFWNSLGARAQSESGLARFVIMPPPCGRRWGQCKRERGRLRLSPARARTHALARDGARALEDVPRRDGGAGRREPAPVRGGRVRALSRVRYARQRRAFCSPATRSSSRARSTSLCAGSSPGSAAGRAGPERSVPAQARSPSCIMPSPRLCGVERAAACCRVTRSLGQAGVSAPRSLLLYSA